MGFIACSRRAKITDVVSRVDIESPDVFPQTGSDVDLRTCLLRFKVGSGYAVGLESSAVARGSLRRHVPVR